jgi:N-acetyl-alpha-D-muramate 1-phosphate uridylyltransferase
LDAFLLAAGLGTRLGRLTRDRPKALVEVAGVAMLEHVARRVVRAGADRLIINVHHFADRIEAFVAEGDGFGARGEVLFSREQPAPLETGGGLLHAAPLFRRDAPFVIHNTDVLSDLPLARMYAEHQAGDALVTLAVNRREAARYLYFDDRGLCGHEHVATQAETWVRAPSGPVRRAAFCGVHVASPALLDRITERGGFPIMRTYLRLAGEGWPIRAYDIGDARWLDIGTQARLEAAEQALAERPLEP